VRITEPAMLDLDRPMGKREMYYRVYVHSGGSIPPELNVRYVVYRGARAMGPDTLNVVKRESYFGPDDSFDRETTVGSAEWRSSHGQRIWFATVDQYCQYWPDGTPCESVLSWMFQRIGVEPVPHSAWRPYDGH
jgi:hypothetical protein